MASLWDCATGGNLQVETLEVFYISLITSSTASKFPPEMILIIRISYCGANGIHADDYSNMERDMVINVELLSAEFNPISKHSENFQFSLEWKDI